MIKDARTLVSAERAERHSGRGCRGVMPPRQVGGLTANYFCILPTILPKLAPVFSPVMEGIFNLLLAWSVLFSGFLVDGRKKVRQQAKPRKQPAS